MIQCHLCNLQYFWETLPKRLFLNKHRRPVLNPTGSCVYTAVSELFLNNNHSETHMLLIEKFKRTRFYQEGARNALFP